jgi:hypothetical protein
MMVNGMKDDSKNLRSICRKIFLLPVLRGLGRHRIFWKIKFSCIGRNHADTWKSFNHRHGGHAAHGCGTRH